MSAAICDYYLCITDINWDAVVRVCTKETSAKKRQNWAVNKNLLSVRCKKRHEFPSDVPISCYATESWVSDSILMIHKRIGTDTQLNVQDNCGDEKLHYCDHCLDNNIWDTLLLVYCWQMVCDLRSSWAWRSDRKARKSLVLVEEFCSDTIISARVYHTRCLARKIFTCSFYFAAFMCNFYRTEVTFVKLQLK